MSTLTVPYDFQFCSFQAIALMHWFNNLEEGLFCLNHHNFFISFKVFSFANFFKNYFSRVVHSEVYIDLGCFPYQCGCSFCSYLFFNEKFSFLFNCWMVVNWFWSYCLVCLFASLQVHTLFHRSVWFLCTISFILYFFLFIFLFILGAFEDRDIIHVDDTVDPVRDLEVISEELRLKVCLILQFLLYLNYNVGVKLVLLADHFE